MESEGDGVDHVGAVLQQLAKVKEEHKQAVDQMKRQLVESKHQGAADTKYWRGIALSSVVVCLSCLVAAAARAYYA